MSMFSKKELTPEEKEKKELAKKTRDEKLKKIADVALNVGKAVALVTLGAAMATLAIMHICDTSTNDSGEANAEAPIPENPDIEDTPEVNTEE